jgi:hypothetical protein
VSAHSELWISQCALRIVFSFVHVVRRDATVRRLEQRQVFDIRNLTAVYAALFGSGGSVFTTPARNGLVIDPMYTKPVSKSDAPDCQLPPPPKPGATIVPRFVMRRSCLPSWTERSYDQYAVVIAAQLNSTPFRQTGRF